MSLSGMLKVQGEPVQGWGMPQDAPPAAVQVMNVSALVTLPFPAMATVSVSVSSVNEAPTVAAALVVTLQAPAPVQAPVQPVKCEPVAGVGVSVTCVPQSNGWLQEPVEQVRPAGFAVTLPWPFPLNVTVNVLGF